MQTEIMILFSDRILFSIKNMCQFMEQYYSAKRTLKEKCKVPKIALSSWKKEKQQLRVKKTGLEVQCKPIRKKVDRLMKIRYQAYTVERAEERARNQQRILIRNKKLEQPDR